MISPFDILLILIGLAAVVIGIAVRYARALLLLFGTYLVSLFAGYLYRPFARFFFAVGHGTAWFDALSFAIFFVGGMLAIYFGSRHYFPDTTLPKLGALDFVLGGVVGLVMGLIWMAITYGAIHLLVSRPWAPQVNYYNLYNLYTMIHLGPVMKKMLAYYALLFTPFSWQIGLPPVFVP